MTTNYMVVSLSVSFDRLTWLYTLFFCNTHSNWFSFFSFFIDRSFYGTTSTDHQGTSDQYGGEKTEAGYVIMQSWRWTNPYNWMVMFKFQYIYWIYLYLKNRNKKLRIIRKRMIESFVTKYLSLWMFGQWMDHYNAGILQLTVNKWYFPFIIGEWFFLVPCKCLFTQNSNCERNEINLN